MVVMPVVLERGYTGDREVTLGKAMVEHYDLHDRFAGAILGSAFGDALGAAVEGWSAEEIAAVHGEVRDYLDNRLGAGCYTDDTQMTLAMLRSLVRRGAIDGADCARSCAELFDPDRGYGRSAIEVLLALAGGADYTGTGNLLFAEGSYGNGAAMRIAPVGLLCGEMAPEQIRPLVFEAVRATHTHEEAIDGALAVAVAVGRLSRCRNQAELDRVAFLHLLAAHCRTMTMRSRLMLAAILLDEEITETELVNQLGNGVRAIESVPIALYAAMKYADDPEQALVRAVGYGGDADTIAAMTGAVVGALNGAYIFPDRWHTGLERGEFGYEMLRDLSISLAKIAG